MTEAPPEAVAQSPPLPPPPPPRRPRVWTVFAMTIGALLAAMAAAMGAMVVVAIVLVVRGTDAAKLGDVIEAFVGTPLGMIVTVMPAQAAILAVVLTAAARSSQGIRERLGLGRGRIPAWGFPILAVGALAVTFAWNILLEQVFGPITGNLKEFTEALAGASGAMGFVMLLCLSIVPGMVEELLFRGYAQRRLVERWGPVVAIAISSLLFAASHVDPRHAAGVLGVGVWVGVIAWRAGSVWPCVVCHVANNLVGIGLMQVWGGERLTGITEVAWPWYVVVPVVVIGAAGVAGSVVLMVRAGRGPATVPA